MIDRDGAKYIIHVFYRDVGKTGNIVTHNCNDLNEVWARVDRLKRDAKVFKIEVCAILETFIITL